MAATNVISAIGRLFGLGEGQSFNASMSTTTTVTKMSHVYQTQAVADTEEALDLGNVTTPLLVAIKCITNDVDVDTSFVSTFSAEITVNENEFAIFRPTGTIYIKNDDAAEQSTVEAWIWGT